MPVYLSKSSRDALEAQLKEAEEKHRILGQDKADAYANSGDGWHDNPVYNQLLSNEQASERQISDLREKLATAIIFVPPAKRGTEKVQIGSIVEISQYDEKADTETKVIWEVVPEGETDLKTNRIAYNAPLIEPLMTLHPGETAHVKTGNKSYECEVLRLFESREAAGL